MTLEPGCTSEGEKARVCSSCGKTETDTIPSYGGHTDDDSDRVCDVCGDTYPTYPVITGIMGDANEDGVVNVKDATAIQKHIAGLITLTERGLLLADVDRNDNVNIKDATAIQKWIAGIETGTTVGLNIQDLKG